MKHAVLGVGGVGGLVGGVLAAGGDSVIALVRDEASHPSRIEVISSILGDRIGPVEVRRKLNEPVDVLWVATKSHQLDHALKAAELSHGQVGMVIPLLNGIDHVEVLSRLFGDITVPGVIQVQSVREAPGHIRHSQWHVAMPEPGKSWSTNQAHPLELGPSDHLHSRASFLSERLIALGIPTRVRRDAATMLWDKLVIIASAALGSTAAGSVAAMRANPELFNLTRCAVSECVAVAASEGGMVDEARILHYIDTFPGHATSSLQRDLEARRETELDFLSLPVIRRGEARGIAVPAMKALDRMVRQRQREFKSTGATA